MSSKSSKHKKAKRRARAKRERRRRRHLEWLSRWLIARHLRVSVPDEKVRDVLANKHGKSIYPDKMVECRMRCIAIVGAGASASVLARGTELADKLEQTLGRDKAELEHLELVNNCKPDDFETRLVALSKTPEGERKVRDTIAEQYSITYPPVLANELLAHLLKHRFLDAIVTFNFDELLDQSISDELGPGEYVPVVSERDCKRIQPDPDEPDYIPLYVKLHGTASEPGSLRFTSESYYTIPESIKKVIEDLLDAEHCVVINVGSALTSFDFQRLLSGPKRLDVFNLSRGTLEKRERKAINKYRKKARQTLPKKARGGGPRPATFYECATRKQDDCDTHLGLLVKAIRRAAKGSPKDRRKGQRPLVKLRSVRRHETVVKLLGSGRNGVGLGKNPWSEAAEARYLKRRTILELTLAGTKAKGLLSLSPLAEDRPGRYFEEYQRCTKRNGAKWSALCSAAGLEESDEADVLVSCPTVRKKTPKKSKMPKGKRGRGKRGQRKAGSMTGLSKSQRLHKVKPKKLARQVLARIKSHPASRDLKLLEGTIQAMQKESEIELHTQDDRVCSKAFQDPSTLKTLTSLDIYTGLMFKKMKKRDRVYMCAESGAWLARDPIPKLLEKPQKIKALCAFDIDEKKLKGEYRKKQVVQRFVNPWHHNRHMTIVRRGKKPTEAIYFARRLRTPVITAVYLNDMRDVERVTQMFDTRWKDAQDAKQARQAKKAREAKEARRRRRKTK